MLRPKVTSLVTRRPGVWSAVASFASDSRDPHDLANGVDIDSVDAIEQFERYSQLFNEGAVKHQQPPGLKINEEQPSSRTKYDSVGEYAELYGRSFKDFASSSFMKDLVSKDGYR